MFRTDTLSVVRATYTYHAKIPCFGVESAKVVYKPEVTNSR